MSAAIADYLGLSGRELAAALAGGHPIDPAALEESCYLGISLGLPAVIDRLLWKTFMKTFHREPSGQLRGWNVRLEQTGWEGAPTPKTRRGEPICFGHYRVITPERPYRAPPGSLLLDYGAGSQRALDPTRLLRDPLVALTPGSAELLLGWTWVDLLGARLGTPSYFLLKRVGALDHRAPRPG